MRPDSVAHSSENEIADARERLTFEDQAEVVHYANLLPSHGEVGGGKAQ